VEIDAASAVFSPTLQTFGGRIEHLSERECRVGFGVRPEWCNPRGSLQGGVCTVFLDEAMSFAALAALEGHTRFATIDMSVEFLAAVKSDAHLVAVGQVTRRGKRIVFVEGSLESDGRTAVRARAAILVLP
jgi:uncharacterized protein (TIGR00369 family)